MKQTAAIRKLNRDGHTAEKRRKDRRWREALMHPLLAFFGTFFLLLLIFIMKGVYPFGKRSFMFMDMYHQYVPFMTLLWDKLRQVPGDRFYTWRIGMGTDFSALYIYYLASPLHFLVLLFPRKYIIELTTYLCVFKVCVSSFTACLYLQKHFQARGYEKIWFALLYSTCGFMCAYNWNIMWLDVVMLLPLVLLGLERLVRQQKPLLYCLSLFACIYVNFYLSIMVCIFVVLYFLILFLTERRKGKILLQFAGYSLLAGMLAGVLLVPEVCSLMQSSFAKPTFPKEIESYFTIFEVLCRHAVDVTAERGLDHWPNIYTGALTFLLIPCFVWNSEISARRRFVKLAVVGVFLLSFSTNLLDFLWHGLNYPDSLPGRQTFLYCFWVLVICYEAFLHLDAVSKKQILGSYLGAVAFLLLCEQTVEEEWFERDQLLLTILFVTLYAVILYLYRCNRDSFLRLILGLTMTAVIFTETGINTYDTSTGTTSRDAYLENLEDYTTLYRQVQKERPDEFFRMEKWEKKTKNDGILSAYPSASVFSSTLNSRMSNLYERLGMRYSKVFYCFDGNTALTAALFQVDYLFRKEGAASEEEDTVEKRAEIGREENAIYSFVGRENVISLYENRYRLPFGYVAPYGFDLPETGHGIVLQNKLAEQLGIEEQLFQRADTRSVQNEVTLTAKERGVYYAVLNTSGIKKLRTEDAVERHYTDLKKKSVLYVGELAKGQKVLFTNEEGEDTKTFKLDVYLLKEEVLEEMIRRLSQTHLENVKVGERQIEGTLQLDEPGRLILSVPYEEGWSVLVNGVKTQPATFGEALIALDLEAGTYEIRLSFFPKGRKAGLALSAFGAVWLVLLICRKKHKGGKRYPAK